MDPLTLAIMGGMNLGKLAMGLFSKPNIPDEIEEAYGLFQKQAKYGLPTNVEKMLLNQGMTGINTMASARQGAGAMALASRGMGSSSAADAMLSRVDQIAMDEIGKLNTSIALQDLQAKQMGAAAMAEVAGQIAQIKQRHAEGAGSMVGGGIAGLANMFMEDPLDPMKQFLAMLMNGGGEAATKPSMFQPYIPMTPEGVI